MDQVENLRSNLYLHPNITNLNLGSCSVSPRPLWEIAQQRRQDMAQDPVGYLWGRMVSELEDSREALADYFNCRADQLALMENASFAMNTIARGLTWGANSEVLMTDQEYEHYLPLWQRTSREFGFKIQTITLPQADTFPDASPQDIIDAFETATTNKTTHYFFSHISAPTGLKLPAAELVKSARKNNIITIVDGAHAPGNIPIDLAKIQPDYYFGNLHKWLMNPPTAGFLYARAPDGLQPLLTSNHYSYDEANPNIRIGEDQPTAWCANLEYHGTQDRVTQSLGRNLIAFRKGFGEDFFYQHMDKLSAFTYDLLKDEGFELVSFRRADLRSAMVTFKIPPVDELTALKWFRHNGFEVAFKTLRQKTFIRLSLPAFIVTEDIERFVKLLATTPWESIGR